MSYSIEAANEDEKNMCSILEKGLEEIKNSSQSALTSNINNDNISTSNNYASTQFVNKMNTFANNNETEFSFDQTTTNKITKHPAKHKFKDMEKKLEALQAKISNLDKKLLQTGTGADYKVKKRTRSKSTSRVKDKNFSKIKVKTRKASFSKNKNFEDNKKYKADDNDLWKDRFLKLKQQYSNNKNELITLRKTKNDLEKKLNGLKKKEAVYDELFNENQKLLENNENLYSKLEESEQIRIEQEKLIISLDKEVKHLRTNLNLKNIKNK